MIENYTSGEIFIQPSFKIVVISFEKRIFKLKVMIIRVKYRINFIAGPLL